jgi:hypothetical protein
MYKRIKLERYDSLPDIILTAATKTNAPRIQQTTGSHLTVFHVSGGQLQDLKEQLRYLASESASFASRPEAMELVAETNRCSKLFIVSTTVELMMVSDRSNNYKTVQEQYEDLLPSYVDFNDGCAGFIRRLHSMPVPAS